MKNLLGASMIGLVTIAALANLCDSPPARGATPVATADTSQLSITDPYIEIDQARMKKDLKKYPFLYPGFRFVVQPSAEGGLSIAGVYDGDAGFVLCYSVQNPSNEALTAPLHCNSRITPPGFHVPADVVFGHPGFLTAFKDSLRVLGLGAANALGGVSEVPAPMTSSALATASFTGQAESPISELIGHVQLKKTMDRLFQLANKTANQCDSNPITVPAAYYMADLTRDMMQRVREYEKFCVGHSVYLANSDQSNGAAIKQILKSPDKDQILGKKGDDLYCYEQQHNQAEGVAVTEMCNIQGVTPQAGESGNPELWYPGMPITSDCKKALQSYAAVNADQSTYMFNGKPVPLAAPHLAWLKFMFNKIQGVSPANTDTAVAEHLTQCLMKHPEIAAALQKEESVGDDMPTQDPPAAAPATTAPNAPAPPAGPQGQGAPTS